MIFFSFVEQIYSLNDDCKLMTMVHFCLPHNVHHNDNDDDRTVHGRIAKMMNMNCAPIKPIVSTIKPDNDDNKSLPNTSIVDIIVYCVTRNDFRDICCC